MPTVSETNLIHLQFRGDLEPIPMAQDLDHLGELIDARVKPGLEEMVNGVRMSTVEYAGFAMPRYLHPEQTLDFIFPGLCEDLKTALVGMDMDVASGPRPNRQDFYIHFGDAFDVKAISHQNPEKWREGVYSQMPSSDPDLAKLGTFADDAFILGPHVRTHYEHGLAPGDEFNQPVDSLFDTSSSVYFTGKTILEGLYDMVPHLREGFAIRAGSPARFLTERFGLVPVDTTWLDYHTGLERFWATHHPK